MVISESDFRMILALEQDPLISLSELAEKTELSWPTVKKRFKLLIESQIIRHPTALFTPEKLGLERVSAFVTVPSMDAMRFLEESCKEHPYTLYRARTYSGGFGVFLQYNIPFGTKYYVEQFLEALQQEGYIKDFTLHHSTGYRGDSYPNLNRYNHKDGTWNFSWKAWLKFVHEVKPFNVLREVDKIDFSLIKPIHFEFLRDLSENASLKQADFMKTYSISRTAAFRYYNFVIENIISSIRLEYNRDNFDLTDTYLVIVDDFKLEEYKKLLEAMKQAPPPFRFSVDYTDDETLLIWTNLTPTLANEFIFELFEHYPNTRSYFLNTRDSGSASYLFYPDNFDFGKLEWKASKEYMVDRVLERLFK